MVDARLQENVNLNDAVALLHDAILASRFEDALIQIRAQSLDTLTRLHGNMSVLHLAAYQGWLEGVQFLIVQRGVNVDLFNINGEPALHHALKKNHWGVAVYLIQQGANPEYCDQQKTGILCIIAEQPENIAALDNLWQECAPAVKKRLLKQRNLLGKTPLHIAAMRGSVGLAKWFIDTLQANHFVTPFILKDNAGYTPLHDAVQYGHVPVCDYLMGLGADPYALNVNGDAPIHLAEQRRDLEIARSLHALTQAAFPVFDLAREGLDVAEVKGDVNGSATSVDKVNKLNVNVDEEKDGASPVSPSVKENQLWSNKQYQLLQEMHYATYRSNANNGNVSNANSAEGDALAAADDAVSDIDRLNRCIRAAEELERTLLLEENAQPDDPAIALVFLARSERILLRADLLALTLSNNPRASEAIKREQENVLRETRECYTTAMQYAIAALCHYEKHTPKVYQRDQGQVILALQIQRILIHYRQHRARSAEAFQAFEMLPLSRYRHDIKVHRADLASKLADPAVSTEALLKTNTLFFTGLIKKLIKHAVDLLGVPPCDYAFLAMGSLGRGEMCPYSDFEYAILLPEEAIQQGHDAYFHELSACLHLLVIGLGEVPCPVPVLREGYSPTPKGFSLDVDVAGLTPITNRALINTPQKLARYQTSDDAILRNALRDVSFLTGRNDETLYQAYQQAFTAVMDRNQGSFFTPIYPRQRLALAEILYDLGYFSSTIQSAQKEQQKNRRAQAECEEEEEQKESGMPRLDALEEREDTALSFEVKTELYRLLQRTLAHLALYYGLKHTYGNSGTRLAALQRNGKLSVAVASKWMAVLDTVLRLRFQTQLHYGCERETLYSLESPVPLSRLTPMPPCRIDEALRKQLLSVYQVLCPLEPALHTFLNTEGQKNPFMGKKALDRAEHRQLDRAMLYERMNKTEDARKFYRQAAQLHATDLTIHSYRLRFEESQRVLMERSIFVSQRAGQQWVMQLVLSLKAQHCGKGHYTEAYAQLPSIFRPAFKNALEELKKILLKEKRKREGREGAEVIREEQLELTFLKEIQTQLEEEDVRDLRRNAFSPYFHQQLALYPESARAVGLLSAEDWLWINTQGNVITEQEKKWLHLGGQRVLAALKEALKLKINSAQRKEILLKALETACIQYKKHLHTTLISPEERMRSSIHYGFLLHCGLQLLAEAHTECALPTLQAQVETVDTCLSTLVALLLKEKKHPNDYLEYYRPLNVYLRQSLRTQLIRYQEKDHKHYGFLESVLQTLNACPDESGERAALTLARKKWEEALSVLAESPLDDAGEEKEGVRLGKGAKKVKGIKKEIVINNANPEEDEIALLIPSLNRGQPFRLDSSIVEALLTEGPDYTFKPSNVESGNHKVRRIEHKGRVFYIKADPEMPGMTYLMDELHQRMIGHGTCFSTIARLDIKIKGEEEPRELEPLALQISEAVSGDTLHTVLHHHPERLQHLDYQKFCELAFLAMLTNPEDGLPSNYMVMPLNEVASKLASSAALSSAPPSLPIGAVEANPLQAAAPAQSPLYTLVSVDHDHALFPAYLYDETNQPAGYRLQLKTILFCFPQMYELIHPKARDVMLSIDALTLLRHFLQAAQQENRHYTSLFDASVLKKWHARRKGGSTTIPIPLKTGDAIQLYNKLLRLQKFLRQSLESNISVTLMDCLAQVEPRVAMDYQQAFKNYPDHPVSAVAEGKEGRERENRGEREEKKEKTPPTQARLQSLGLYPANTKGELITRSKAQGAIAQPTVFLSSHLLNQPAYRELADLKPEESLSELDKMAYQASILKEIAQQLQSPDRTEEGIRAFALLVTPEHKSALINGDETLALPPLAWETVSIPHQKELLTLLQKNLPQDGRQEAPSATIYNFGLQKLQLRGCAPQALTLKVFMGILKQCPDLIELDLSNLPELDETWVSTLLNTVPNLQKLTLQRCPSLNTMQFKKPLNHLKEFNLAGTPIQYIVINAPALKYLRLKQCVRLRRIQAESRQLTVFDMRDCRELTMMGLLNLVPEENVEALNEVEWRWQGSGVRVEQENALPEEELDGGAPLAMPVPESKEASFRAASGWQARFFIKARSDVEHFLHLVGGGKQDEAEAMLKVNPSLVLAYGKMTDSAGRQFKRITAFQYALWALDAHMWEMLLKYFKEKHTRLAYEQWVELDSQGTEHGKEISWAPLIRALKTCNDNFKKWSEEQQAQQLTVIGQEQDKLAEHVVSEYCRPDRPFYPTPQFDDGIKLPRGKGQREDKWRQRQQGQVAWTRNGGWAERSNDCDGWRVIGGTSTDHKALLALNKTRIQQKDKLKHQLFEVNIVRKNYYKPRQKSEKTGFI